MARFVARVLVPPPNVKFAPPRHGRKLPNSMGHHGSFGASAEIFSLKGRGAVFFGGTCCYQVLPSDPFRCLTFSGVIRDLHLGYEKVTWKLPSFYGEFLLLTNEDGGANAWL